MFETIIGSLIVGIIATVVLDVWLIFLQSKMTKTPFSGFDLVGRWVGYFPQGRFVHDDITHVPPLKQEKIWGWVVHYMVGIVFASALILIAGEQWLRSPTLLPALAVGIISVAVPFCIMHPALGLGFAASKTPNPWQARKRSVLGHTIFGLGLYVGGLIYSNLDLY